MAAILTRGINFRALLRDAIECLIPIGIAFIIVRFIIFTSVVQSGSMEPTLMTGDTVFFNRLAYISGNVSRGDIIIFWSDEFNCYMSKRVIGTEGDHIEFLDGHVVVNGHQLEEDYIDSSIDTNSVKSFDVPGGCVFLLGDNREESLDSRYWTEPYISTEKIMGKYMGGIPFSIQQDILGEL